MSTKKRKAVVANAAKKARAEGPRYNSRKERWCGWVEGELMWEQWELVSKPEVRNMLHHYYGLMLHDGNKSEAAIATASSAPNMASNTVRGCGESFEAKDGEIVKKNGVGRGGTDRRKSTGKDRKKTGTCVCVLIGAWTDLGLYM